MKCFFVGTDDVWTTPPFLPNMESIMQIYKHLLHNRSIQTAQRKFQHVYSKQSCLIPPPFGCKNRRGSLFSCRPIIALNILLISWNFVYLELIVYAKSRALCCMRAVTWTRKKLFTTLKSCENFKETYIKNSTSSMVRIYKPKYTANRTNTKDWTIAWLPLIDRRSLFVVWILWNFWSFRSAYAFPYQTGLTMTGKGSNSRIIRHVSERFGGQKKKQKQKQKNTMGRLVMQREAIVMKWVSKV